MASASDLLVESVMVPGPPVLCACRILGYDVISTTALGPGEFHTVVIHSAVLQRVPFRM